MSNRTCNFTSCESLIGRHGARGYCPKHYKRVKSTGSPEGLRNSPRGESLEFHLRKYGHELTPGGCWEFGGPRDKDRYGMVSFQRRTQRAHRVAYEVRNGTSAGDLLVRHICDNPPCVNPDHLIAGTAKQNTGDAKERERLANGERHGMHKITDAEVLLIRAEYARGLITQRALAKKYECSQAQVFNIVSGAQRASLTFPAPAIIS